MSIYYLDRDDVLTAATGALGMTAEVADYGLLDSAIARPRSTVFGADAYPDVFEKAAALLHSLARNHCLIDGNKRTAWAAASVFLTVNGHPIDEEIDADVLEPFMNEAAMGTVGLGHISEMLQRFHRGRSVEQVRRERMRRESLAALNDSDDLKATREVFEELEDL